MIKSSGHVEYTRGFNQLTDSINCRGTCLLQWQFNMWQIKHGDYCVVLKLMGQVSTYGWYHFLFRLQANALCRWEWLGLKSTSSMDGWMNVWCHFNWRTVCTKRSMKSKCIIQAVLIRECLNGVLAKSMFRLDCLVYNVCRVVYYYVFVEDEERHTREDIIGLEIWISSGS